MSRLINKTQGYTIVGQNISMDSRLGMKERGLFLTLLSLPDSWEFSVIGLSKILPDGKAAIQSTVQKLEKLGYLKRVQAKGEKGKFAGYDWEIIPQPEIGAPLTENRSTENQSTENPSTKNPTQLTTKVLTTKVSNTKVSNNQSINHSNTMNINSDPEKEKIDRVIDDALISEVKKQIDYDCLAEGGILQEAIAKSDLDAAVQALASLKVEKNEQTFSGIPYSPEFIRQRADSIASDHIYYVFECFYDQREHIRNIQKYLRTSIFNAPATIGAYNSNAVRASGCI